MSPKSKILAVATNAAPVLNGTRSGLFLSELTHFLDLIDRAGYDYDIASPSGGAIPLDENSVTPRHRRREVNARFLDRPEFEQAITASMPVRDADPADYVAIYLAGGHGTMWDFRQSGDLQALLSGFYEAGRWVTAVCHGVSGLVDTVDGAGRRVVDGRRVTGFTNHEDSLARTKSSMPFLLEDALKANGAIFTKNRIPFTSRVEVDGKVLTGQNPQSARALAEALVQRMSAA